MSIRKFRKTSTKFKTLLRQRKEISAKLNLSIKQINLKNFEKWSNYMGLLSKAS